MRGPYLVTALPDDLSGITTELAAALHRAALDHGQPAGPQHMLLMAKTPLLVCVLATALPDQMRLAVTRFPGMVMADQAVMILLTADAHNYLILDVTIDVAELVAVAATFGTGP